MPLFCFIGLPLVNIGKVIAMPRKKSDRERSAFGQRMFLARERSGLTQMEVRALLGVSQGTLSQLEGTAASSGRVVEFAKLYDVDSTWLATGEGIAPPDVAREPMAAHQAHQLSPAPVTSSLQKAREIVPWRELGMRKLKEQFSVEAPDDSMAPVIKRGAILDFDRTLEPRTDDAVLLKDGDGVWHVRTYQAGPRGRWVAKAENGAFLPMDSERDELEVIAVLTAVHGRRG